MKKGNEFLLSNNLYVKVSSLKVTSKFKILAWPCWYLTLNSSSFRYIPEKDLPNILTSFIAQRSSMRALLSGNGLPWFYWKKLVMTCKNCLHRNIEKWFAQNGEAPMPIGMPTDCFIATFPALKKQFSIT